MLVFGVVDVLEPGVGEILNRPRVSTSSSKSLSFVASSKFGVVTFVYYSSVFGGINNTVSANFAVVGGNGINGNASHVNIF